MLRSGTARGMRRSMSGFTMVELMIVMAILVILVAAALPNYNDFVRNQRVKTASFDLFSSLVLARSEALTRNSTITVAATSGTTDWAAGWEVRAGATVLRKQEALPNMVITGPTASFNYNGSGRLTASLASGIQITATGAGITPRCITLDLSGRPVTKAQTC